MRPDPAHEVILGRRDTFHSFLCAMSWGTLKDEVDIDTSGWSFGGDSAIEVRDALAALLAQHSVRLSDVFCRLDTSDDMMINHEEFVDGMHAIGFGGAEDVLEHIWAAMDADNSGAVTFDEVNIWVTGKPLEKRARLNAARKLSLKSRVEASEGPWDVPRVRRELRALCDGAGVHAVDLLETWSTSRRANTLRKRDWLKNFKRLCGVGNSLLWYDYVREAVVDAFEHMDSDHGKTLDITELARFLEPNAQAHSAPPPSSSLHAQSSGRTTSRPSSARGDAQRHGTPAKRPTSARPFGQSPARIAPASRGVAPTAFSPSSPFSSVGTTSRSTSSPRSPLSPNSPHAAPPMSPSPRQSKPLSASASPARRHMNMLPEKRGAGAFNVAMPRRGP